MDELPVGCETGASSDEVDLSVREVRFSRRTMRSKADEMILTLSKWYAFPSIAKSPFPRYCEREQIHRKSKRACFFCQAHKRKRKSHDEPRSPQLAPSHRASLRCS